MSGKSKKSTVSKLSGSGSDHHHPVVDLYRRQLGDISSRKFCNRFSSSENMVLRLTMDRKLKKQDYDYQDVTSISFNAEEGDRLISGHINGQVAIWDWQLGNVKLGFDSGHHESAVLQAKFMPFSNDRTIVTSGSDGKVRRGSILESGKVETSVLGLHRGRVHKLCIEQGSPNIFYTCDDQDGYVQCFDLRTQSTTKIITCNLLDNMSVRDGSLKLNAMAINPRNSNHIAVGGSEMYARLFDIRSNQRSQAADYFCPPCHMYGPARFYYITGLAFSEKSELLVSYREDFMYLLTPDMGLGSTYPFKYSASSSSSDPVVYKGHNSHKCSMMETVTSVCFFGHWSEYVISGAYGGHIFIWKKQNGELLRVMKLDKCVTVKCIEPHPCMPMLASCGNDGNISLWAPKAKERAKLDKKWNGTKSLKRTRTKPK